MQKRIDSHRAISEEIIKEMERVKSICDAFGSDTDLTLRITIIAGKGLSTGDTTGFRIQPIVENVTGLTLNEAVSSVWRNMCEQNKLPDDQDPLSQKEKMTFYVEITGLGKDFPIPSEMIEEAVDHLASIIKMRTGQNNQWTKGVQV